MSGYTAEMAHAAVARGAAWLDKRYPDWERTVNTHSLDLNSPNSCILGQTADKLVPVDSDLDDCYTPYAAALEYFAPTAQNKWAARYGFDLPNLGDEFSPRMNREYPIYYEMLTIAWKDLIRQRLEPKS